MSNSPLYVKVTESRYDMFGTPTFRNRMLAKLLTRMGGINESVPPGTYIFSVRLNKKLQLITDLKEA